MRRRDEGERPTYSGFGSRMEQLLRLAEEQREQILAVARTEADGIVEEARRQAEQILADARARAGQIDDGDSVERGAG
jgi:cell division septum initiation protein DivIVA